MCLTYLFSAQKQVIKRGHRFGHHVTLIHTLRRQLHTYLSKLITVA